MDDQPDPEPASDDEFTRDVIAGLGGTAAAPGSNQEPEHNGPGNSTRVYVPGAHTRAQGGGGLYGISKRKAERKAAKAAAKQRHVAQQAEHARHAREVRKARQQPQQHKQQKQEQKQQQAAPSHPAQANGRAKAADLTAAAGPKAAAAMSSQKAQQQARQQQGKQVPKDKRKRQDQEPQRKQESSKYAKFEEFLGDLAQSGHAAIDDEKRRYRALAKKLKLRRKGRTSALGDGLDDFTTGITAAAMTSSDSEADSGEGDYPAESDSGSDSDSMTEQGEKDSVLLLADTDAGAGSEDDSQLASSEAQSVEESQKASSEEDGEASDMADSEEQSDMGGPSDEGVSDSGSERDDVQPRPNAAAGGAYVPPALRGYKSGSGDAAKLQARVRGLLNRLAEANLPGIAAEVAQLMTDEGRLAVTQAIFDELLSAAAEGPRATDAFAAVAAACVAGVGALANTQEVGARFMAALATRLEGARGRGDGLACHNLAMVAVHAFLAGLIGPPVLYSLLAHLTSRFEEQDVAMMSAALRVAGLQLRSADPAAMKDFLVAVHARAAEAAKAGAMSARAEVMLSLLLDIKNNRQRGGGAGAVTLTAGTQKWLKSVGAPTVALHSMSWDKLLAPDKKGLWWLPAAGEALPSAPAACGGGAVAAAGADAELLRLAAAARMNTDVRRAVFCCVMGAEDATDAFERLLRLGLKGEAEREVVRVPVECCLQEAGWNPYYALLLGRLAAATTSHAVTLQYCLWDHFKGVAEADPRRAAHLSRLTAALISGTALPLSVLKVICPSDLENVLQCVQVVQS